MGKIEAGISEDDSRNSGVIADNAGSIVEMSGLGVEIRKITNSQFGCAG